MDNTNRARTTRRPRRRAARQPQPFIINDSNINVLIHKYFENDLPPELRLIPIGDWDVSAVTTMSGLFRGRSEFNEPLNRWNVSNVIEMDGMFYGCTQFNQPLDGWNTANVTRTGGMFYGCTRFNQPLDGWNVSRVVIMDGMFNECVAFSLCLWRPDECHPR